MGTSKAALEWHGSTLLARIVGIVGRAVDAPVVVVRAPGQDLPRLPPGISVVEDLREGRGPLQGLAAGLAAVEDRAEIAYLSCTDVPLLHPAFVRAVLDAIAGGDVALPYVHGFRHPLAAGYRTALRPLVDRLLAADRLAPAFLFELVKVRAMDAQALLDDPVLAALDPGLDSLLNLNQPDDYAAARRRPAPKVTVERWGASGTEGSGSTAAIRAATLGNATKMVGVALDQHVVLTLNGERAPRDPELPLATGDVVSLRSG